MNKEETVVNDHRTHLRLLVGIGLAAICLGLVAGCGDSASDEGGGGETAASAEGGSSSGDVAFGLVSPLSKSTAFLGQAYQQGAELAVEQINADGGVAGQQASLDSVDDEGQPSASVTAVSKLIDVDDVDAIIGPSSLTVNAVIDRIKRSGIPNVGLAPTSGADGLWGGTAWRILPSDSLLGVVMSQAALDLGAKDAGTLMEETAASQSIKNQVEKSYPALGGEISKEVDVPPGQSNYSSEALDLLAEDRPPLVFYDMAPETATTFWNNAQQFADALDGFKVLGSDVVISEESLQAFGDTADQLELFVVAPREVGPGRDEYASAFTDKFGGSEPAEFSSYAYDALMIAALAMDKAGSTEHAAVAKAVPEVAAAPGTQCTSYAKCKKLLEAGKEIDYQGASGELEIDEKGEVFGSFSLVRYKDGKTSEVEVYDEADIQAMAENARQG